MRTTPGVCSGRTFTTMLKTPLLAEAGLLLSLKSYESETLSGLVGGSAPAGTKKIPILETTKSAAQRARRMRMTIPAFVTSDADNVRYVKLERNSTYSARSDSMPSTPHLSLLKGRKLVS